MPQLRQHKTFSDIEQDINRYYYDGTVDALTTALSVASRALTVAYHCSEPVNRQRIEVMYEVLRTLIQERQREKAQQ
jgi:hypothetical protein